VPDHLLGDSTGLGGFPKLESAAVSRWQCRPALQVFLWSRAAIWAATILAFLWFEPKPPPLQHRWDSPYLHDLGWLTDVWARWDSRWFVQIAEHAYSSSQTAAFFPLYPGVVAVLGRVLLGHYVLAGIVVSLAACAGSFVLFHRLAERRLGLEGAQRALVYLAIFPTALFFFAGYSESLFLVLTVACFYHMRRRQWLLAGFFGGLASATRVTGVLLFVPYVYEYGRACNFRRREMLRGFGRPRSPTDPVGARGVHAVPAARRR